MPFWPDRLAFLLERKPFETARNSAQAARGGPQTFSLELWNFRFGSLVLRGQEFGDSIVCGQNSFYITSLQTLGTGS